MAGRCGSARPFVISSARVGRKRGYRVRARIAIFTSIIQAILFAVHWFVYATWMSFAGPANALGVSAAKIILLLLSVIFVIPSLLPLRYSNLLIPAFYTY